MPRQEVCDMPGRVIGDAGEQVGEIVLRVEGVELGGFDQRMVSGRAPAAGIGAGEEIVLAADRDAAKCPLSTDVQNWTLFDIENWTPGLAFCCPRLDAGVACPGSA
jgi:hypothetical protein